MTRASYPRHYQVDASCACRFILDLSAFVVGQSVPARDGPNWDQPVSRGIVQREHAHRAFVSLAD